MTVLTLEPDGRRGGRAAIGLADQVLSGGSNFLFVILVARNSSVELFGSFSLGYAVLAILVVCARSSIGTPLVLDASAPGLEIRDHLGHGLLLGLFLGLSGTLLVIPLVLLPGGDVGVRSLAILLGVAAPVAVVHDVLRHGSSAQGRPWVALAMDGIWTTAIVGGALWSLVVGALSTTSAVTIWLCGGLIGIPFAFLLKPRLTRGSLAIRLRESAKTRLQLLTDVVMGQGVVLLVLVIAVAALGTQASAALRGAGTIMGPLNLLYSFLTFAVLPELVGQHPRRIVRTAERLALVLAGVSLIWGAIVLLLSPTWGRALLGSSWQPAREILPFTIVEYIFLSGFIAGATALRALGKFHLQLASGLVRSIVLLLFGTTAMLAGFSVSSMALAYAVAAAAGGIAVWLMVLRVHRTSGQNVIDG